MKSRLTFRSVFTEVHILCQLDVNTLFLSNQKQTKNVNWTLTLSCQKIIIITLNQLDKVNKKGTRGLGLGCELGLGLGLGSGLGLRLR